MHKLHLFRNLKLCGKSCKEKGGSKYDDFEELGEADVDRDDDEE